MFCAGYWIIVFAYSLVFYDVTGLPSPAGNNLSLKNYGYGFHDFLWLMNNRINQSGYLVEIQYFKAGGHDKPCDTYAAIWRSPDMRNFKRIIQVKVQPEKSTDGLTKIPISKMIRLQINDLISIFVGDKIGCTGSVISHKQDDQEPQSISLTIDYDRILTAEHASCLLSKNLCLFYDYAGFLSGGHLWLEHRAVAIQVYVERYAVLHSAPFAFHSKYLSPGQIQISWSSYISNDTNFKLAGYRLVCFTGKLLPPKPSDLKCNESLDSKKTEIVLKNLITTKPIYASIQIIRNFHGHNITDEDYSAKSAPFCPERESLLPGQVRMIEAPSVKNKTVILAVSVKGLDECVSEWSVVMKGPNKPSKVQGSSARKTLHLLLKHNISYNMTVSFKLVDGFEVKVFNSIYQTGQFPSTDNQENKMFLKKLLLTMFIFALAAGAVVILSTGISRYYRKRSRNQVKAQELSETSKDSLLYKSEGEPPAANESKSGSENTNHYEVLVFHSRSAEDESCYVIISEQTNENIPLDNPPKRKRKRKRKRRNTVMNS